MRKTGYFLFVYFLLTKTGFVLRDGRATATGCPTYHVAGMPLTKGTLAEVLFHLYFTTGHGYEAAFKL